MEYDTKVRFGFMLMLLHKRRRFIVIQSNTTENDATLSLNKLKSVLWLAQEIQAYLLAARCAPECSRCRRGPACGWSYGLTPQTWPSPDGTQPETERSETLTSHDTSLSYANKCNRTHTHNTRWYTPVSVSWKSGSVRWRPLGFLLKVPGSGGILLLSSSSLKRTQKHIKSHLKLKNSPSHTENITRVEWSHSGSATAPASLCRSVKQLPGRIKPLPASL